MLVENNLKNLKTSDLIYFKGKNYFKRNDGAQNTLVFQTMQNHFNLSNVNQINKWKSKGLSNQYLNLNGKMDDVALSKPIKSMYVIFKGKSILYDHDNNVIAGEPIVNIYIVCKTSSKTINSSFASKNCLIGAVKITINNIRICPIH